MIKRLIIKFLKFIKVIPKDNLIVLENAISQVKNDIQSHNNQDPLNPDGTLNSKLYTSLFIAEGFIDQIKKNNPKEWK
tara:strand:+ start:301 stop:534 length:234 start_codon:yes stop_codon:yes gene_type:complete